MTGQSAKDARELRAPRPWTSGPAEILQHGLDLLEQDTDKSRRLAMLSIDNAVELIIKTYLGAPKRAYDIEISRKEYAEASHSFPKLVEALENHASERLVGVALDEIEWFHWKRNDLYHNGNGLTVEREKVKAYGQLARNLFYSLFGYEVMPSPTEMDPIAAFLAQWAAIDSAVLTLFNQKGLSIQVRGSRAPVGAGTLLNALSTAGLISKDQLRELTELRAVRNILIHSENEGSPEVDRVMVERLKRVRDDLEGQIETS